MFNHFDDGNSSPELNFSGSSDTFPIGATPYHSSPILSYPPSGTSRSQSANQMLRSLMESQKKVLSVVENVSQRLDDLEQLVQVVTTGDGDGSSSSKAGAKTRVPSQLTVCKLIFCYSV